MSVSVQEDDFNMAEEYALLAKHSSASGAVVTFVGLVRDVNQGNEVDGLYLEHYPAMTQKVLQDIVSQANARWSLGAVRIIHRVGQLGINDQIVFVGVTSAHRQAAFEAAAFIMDILKTRAPFWKKELSGDQSYWVDAKVSDEDQAKRWSGSEKQDSQVQS